GMVESFEGEAGLESFKAGWTPFIEAARAKKMRLILLTPIAYEFLGPTTPRVEERNVAIKAYAEAMKEIGREHGLPVIDLFEATRGLKKGPRLTHNGIHLTSYGYWAISQILADGLAPLDGANRSYDAGGLKGFAFTMVEQHLPAPAPPGDLWHEAFDDKPFRLTVRNLKPGSYTLKAGGKSLATFNHRAWAEGVPISSSPLHDQTEALREAIQTKNGQFFRRWRPLNTVHIVGQRKSSPSGRALPGELKEMEKHIAEQEQRIPGLTRPDGPMRWELVPVTD
ncbi:MAG: GDSL-type esterase/lipase family protein, partial [Verrucomicrobiota bacterium]